MPRSSTPTPWPPPTTARPPWSLRWEPPCRPRLPPLYPPPHLQELIHERSPTTFDSDRSRRPAGRVGDPLHLLFADPRQDGRFRGSGGGGLPRKGRPAQPP